jgi:shikimate 5-dehydrogenase
MLIYQGAAAFEKWHGVSPDIFAMEKAFREAE